MLVFITKPVRITGALGSSLYSLCIVKSGALVLNLLQACPKVCWHGRPELVTIKGCIVEQL